MTKTAPLRSRSIELDLSTLNLHPEQVNVINHPARFKLLRAGRRWRKSASGVIQAFTGYDGPNGRRFLGAFDGGHIGWWVPSLTARYIVADWIPIREIAAQIPGSRVEEANHRVIMPNKGGSIMMLTGDNIDSGRGLGLDGAVLDEASLLQEPLWTETIRATLLDRIGWALFLYTPKGQNWVYDLSESVKDLPDWHEWQFKSEDNPFVDPNEIADIRRLMSTMVQRQELDAEYITSGAGMFYRQWFRHYGVRWKPGPKGEDEKWYLLGDEMVSDSSLKKFHTVDLAWSLEEHADFTVISSWGKTPRGHLLLLDVLRGHFEGPDIVPKLKQVKDRFGGHITVEHASRQMLIFQEAVRAGLPVKEVKADKDKVSRALPATAWVEQGKVWFPPPGAFDLWPVIEAEMLAFPAGRHDDFVDTLAYAVEEAGRKAAALHSF